MMDSTTASKDAQFIPADDDEFDESSMPAFSGAALPAADASPVSNSKKGKIRAEAMPIPSSSGAGGSAGLSGNIGSVPVGVKPAVRQTVGGVQVETRYAGDDTLDEPVLTTISRDLLSIYSKLIQVLYPRRTDVGKEALRRFQRLDLWGPLILCLALGITLSVNVRDNLVFTGVVVIVSLGSLTVTLNTKLLGGRVSFFQSLCVLGYSGIISAFVRVLWVRGPVALGAWAWSVWASINFLDGTKIEQQRIMLAVYPILLFYFILAWMILIQ
ncbi:hypothetical protein BS47DRAFT_1373362 [Hydnum rufescens UP504]|uniref:Protein YIP n=1 Tax=Hydnum rufescens UP504 TaxID=1448309 RepID=A0A9P6DU52_9AGAM|nr:hypothetical protein BS47DRAFT_1373362 [Hydnum rufescens UP504]